MGINGMSKKRKPSLLLYILLAAYLALVAMFITILVMFPQWVKQQELRYSSLVQDKIYTVIKETPKESLEKELVNIRDAYPFEISIYKKEQKIFQTLPEISFSNLRNVLQDDVIIIEQQGVIDTDAGESYQVWYSIYRLPVQQYLDSIFMLQILLIGVSFLIVLTVSIILQKMLIKPLNQVKDSIGKLEAYDLDAIESSSDVINEGVKRFAVGLQGKITAVSRNHTALEQALQSERERLANMMTVSRGVIHDLKSPLHQTMIENDYFLKESVDISKEARVVAEYNRERMDKIIGQVNEVLNLLDTDPKTMVEVKNEFDIIQLFKDIRKGFSVFIQNRNVSFYADMPEELLVYLNKVSIHLIIHNMLSNAVKYAKPTSEIEFEIYVEDDVLHISCSNEASKKDIERIHDSEQLFTAIVDETNTEGEYVYSTGNGLYLIKELASLVEGTYSLGDEQNTIIVSVNIPLQ